MDRLYHVKILWVILTLVFCWYCQILMQMHNVALFKFFLYLIWVRLYCRNSDMKNLPLGGIQKVCSLKFWFFIAHRYLCMFVLVPPCSFSDWFSFPTSPHPYPIIMFVFLKIRNSCIFLLTLRGVYHSAKVYKIFFDNSDFSWFFLGFIFYFCQNIHDFFEWYTPRFHPPGYKRT